jgi:4-amino-4-deoxy-L-arabinose transferase-like glycosyltransferase
MAVADRKPKTLPASRAASATTVPLSTGLLAILLVLLLSVTVGTMAYQVPPAGRVAIGWPGDRLFLDARANVAISPEDRGALYPDDLTPTSPTGRSRWTREYARIVLPNMGRGADLDLSMLVQGWPEGVFGQTVTQPTVQLLVDGRDLGVFTPTSAWAELRFALPAAQRSGDDLTIELFSAQTFTDTLAFGADPRPKGVRLAEVRVEARSAGQLALYPPAPRAVAMLVTAVLLAYLLARRLLHSTPLVFVLTTFGAGLAGIGLAVGRIWMGAALGVAIWALMVALAITFWNGGLALTRAFVRRYTLGRALGYGLVTASLAWVGYTIGLLSQSFQFPGLRTLWERFPDTLLYSLLSAGLLALIFVLGREGLPRVADGIVGLLASPRSSLVLLALFGLIWIGYAAAVALALPYVGHADYSDNAVVARNLASGRGWVVDYVTQFFSVYNGLTRPQETWPLLQPVWIAPFFLLFGATDWAAKIPNVLFNIALLLLIYHIGTRIWDRRVGLLAAIFVLTNYLFFRLTIYVTSDLAFVVLSIGAIYWLYQALQHKGTGPQVHGANAVTRSLLISALLTGLMMLQKPSGAMIALGMGLWMLAQRRTQIVASVQALFSRKPFWQLLQTALLPIVVWSTVALLVLSPYIVRNMLLFSKPVYSTESHDAWILGYRGDGIAWDDIYRVYAPEWGGPGVPDRSWILRWGFDYTAAKFMTQLRALRDYLLPVWRGLPDALQPFTSADESKNIAAPLAAWLALLGVIGALRFRRRLLNLLAWAYAPYMLFMLTYWRTNEERYWVILIPWLCLLAAWMLWAAYDRLASIGDRRWAPLGLLLVIVGSAGIIGFSRPDIARKVVTEPGLWQPDLIAYEWLEQNTPPGTVMMTRLPWQLNWHAQRPAVMIPNTADRELLMEIARHYNAEYLVLENLQRVKGDAAANLGPLTRPGDAPVGTVIDGFELVYASPTPDFRVFIYRFP